MPETTRKLRVLIVDGTRERLREVTTTVTALGHEVVGKNIEPVAVAQATVEELPE